MRKEDQIRQLREELANAMEHIEDELSLQRIEELTAELECLEPVADEFDIVQAETEFFQEYLPLVEERRGQAQLQRGKNHKDANKIRFGRRLRAAVVLAAIFLCLNGATVAIADMNIFEALFKWDEDTFQINAMGSSMGSPAEEIDKTQFFDEEGTEWTELEEKLGTEIPVIGYFVENMEIKELKYLGDDYANIVFSNGDGEYLYTVQKLDGEMDRLVEKVDDLPTEFSFDGITYFFAKNRNWLTIIWQYNNQIYTIMGDFDEGLAETIVKSIQYEEE